MRDLRKLGFQGDLRRGLYRNLSYNRTFPRINCVANEWWTVSGRFLHGFWTVGGRYVWGVWWAEELD